MATAPTKSDGRTVMALSGGIGGAKLALGLARVLAPGQLTVVGNTGDDFDHLGLRISPDLDTVLYTLAGINNPETGWGQRDESWNFMAALAGLGGETWFKLGDRDLAVHVERTRRLRAGESLSVITADFARRLGLSVRLLPMSDDPIRTRVKTARGWLDFQEYFVHQQCQPIISGFEFAGAAVARAQPDVLAQLAEASLRAVVICPSNPFISIDPILAVPGLRAALAKCPAPVIAVSPVIAGRAVKGPTAKMMAELGLECSSATVARHYHDIIDGYVADPEDASAGDGLDIAVTVAPTLMVSMADRENLARIVLQAADQIGHAA
ncbi:MAG: 2-phospho-L-lactate transferase [Alphaproteobacteria bacterium]|nr:2-phospho-L-lactate transferase [Alphaproteobacteria bacterium]